MPVIQIGYIWLSLSSLILSSDISSLVLDQTSKLLILLLNFSVLYFPFSSIGSFSITFIPFLRFLFSFVSRQFIMDVEIFLWTTLDWMLTNSISDLSLLTYPPNTGLTLALARGPLQEVLPTPGAQVQPEQVWPAGSLMASAPASRQA